MFCHYEKKFYCVDKNRISKTFSLCKEKHYLNIVRKMKISITINDYSTKYYLIILFFNQMISERPFNVFSCNLGENKHYCDKI